MNTATILAIGREAEARARAVHGGRDGTTLIMMLGGDAERRAQEARGGLDRHERIRRAAGQHDDGPLLKALSPHPTATPVQEDYSAAMADVIKALATPGPTVEELFGMVRDSPTAVRHRRLVEERKYLPERPIVARDPLGNLSGAACHEFRRTVERALRHRRVQPRADAIVDFAHQQWGVAKADAAEMLVGHAFPWWRWQREQRQNGTAP